MKRPRLHDDYCWVDDGQDIVHVSKFAKVPRAALPAVRCPICQDRAILHLGKKKAHHYQHDAKRSSCALSSRESALHFNAKFHLRNVLSQGAAVTAAGPCSYRAANPESSVCTPVESHSWPVTWDEVRVEAILDPLRPDVLLLKGGQPVGAVEVRVTHGVSDEKAAMYDKSNVLWLEVEAESALKWNGDVLSIITGTGLPVWTCHAHRALQDWASGLSERTELEFDPEAKRQKLMTQFRRESELQAWLLSAALEADQSTRRTFVRFRAVDAVYSSGRRERYIFRVMWDNDRTAMLTCDQFPSYRSDDSAPSGRRTLDGQVLNFL